MATELGVNRRSVVIGGGAALALAASFGARSVSAAQKGIQSGGGIAGGGVIETADGGTATFSVFGSRFDVDGLTEPLFFGSLSWSDASGVTLVSTEITAYGPVAGEEETARELSGLLTMNGEGSLPFTIKLVDGGAPGEGKDAVTLTVGAAGEMAASPVAAEAVYAADATLTGGDLQLLTFAFPE